MTMKARDSLLRFPRRTSVVLAGAGLVLGGLALLSGCKREARNFHAAPAIAEPPGGIPISGLHPGGAKPPPHQHNGYEDNAYAVSEGKRLFSSFNCSGCHGNGGGNMGPPLIDSTWIYGSEPDQIFATIREGRPNGMPAFGDKINTQQIWELVAYVRSLAGLVPKDVASGRSDHMKSKPPENSIDPSPPTAPNIPPSAERPE